MLGQIKKWTHHDGAEERDSTRRREDEIAALVAKVEAQEQEIVALRAHTEELQAKMSEHTAQLTHISKSDFRFKVAQYNILAGYLGDNKQPWFLYGIPMDEERRARITAKFYEKDEAGKYKNVGWPTWAGDLTDEERQIVEDIDAEHFAWDKRRDRLVKVILDLDADVISLVELDHYDDFFQPTLLEAGYESVWTKRPRPSSADGCGIFWRTSVFELVASEAYFLNDEFNSRRQEYNRDRVMLIVLLRHRATGRRLIYVSVHLARNPEDESQTKNRARQAAQIFQKITCFAVANGALDEPAVLAGDLNTTRVRQLGNIARAVFTLANEPAHSFIYEATAPRTTPTSVTTSRKVRIDYMLTQPSKLDIVDSEVLPVLKMSRPLPNELYPSDHVPIAFTLEFKSSAHSVDECARAWALQLLHDHSNSLWAPLSLDQLAHAFDYFDLDTEGLVRGDNLGAGMREIGLAPRTAELQLAVLDEFEKISSPEHLPFNGRIFSVKEDNSAAAAGCPVTRKGSALLDEESPATRKGCALLNEDSSLIKTQPSRMLVTALTASKKATVRKTVHSVILNLHQFTDIYERSYFRWMKSDPIFTDDMLEAFSFFDTDGNGMLTCEEMRTSFNVVCPFPGAEAIFQKIWPKLLPNKAGEVSLEHFIASIFHAQYNSESEAVQQAMREHDSNTKDRRSIGAFNSGDDSPHGEAPPDADAEQFAKYSHMSLGRAGSTLTASKATVHKSKSKSDGEKAESGVKVRRFSVRRASLTGFRSKEPSTEEPTKGATLSLEEGGQSPGAASEEEKATRSKDRRSIIAVTLGDTASLPWKRFSRGPNLKKGQSAP